MQAAKRHSPETPPPLRLLTLGGFTLVSSPVNPAELVLGPGKPLALLLYLHSAPARAASREQLIDLLWADLEPAAGRHALRQTLWYLRQRIGSEHIRTDNGNVVLRLPLTCDRDDFVRLISDGCVEDAVAIYTGHFLPDFAVPGGIEFEHWSDAERSRLRLMFLRTAETVVRTWLSTGHMREARALALRVRNGSPHSEAAWRLYLETLAVSQDSVGALAEAERMLATLRHEGRAPEAATSALVRAIQREPEQVTAPSTGLVAELVGREREFAAIVDAWDVVRSGRRTHVHVSAAAGLGKTRLLLDAEARLAVTGGRCVYARANPGERAVPFAMAAELAAKLVALRGAKGVSPASAGVLVALNPALSSTFSQPGDAAVGEEAARHRALAMTELVQVLTDEAPLAVFIDDLHWADLASRQLVDRVLDRLTGDRVLVVTSARPTPGIDPTQAALRLDLPPLGREQIAALLASLGELPDEFADVLPELLLNASRGSPLLVLESLQAALDVGVLHLEDGQWTAPTQHALFGQFTHGSAVHNRLARLDRKHSWLVLLMATAGLPLPAETLAAAAGRRLDAVAAELLDLERLGLVQHTVDGWEPMHDAIGEVAVIDATEEATRAAMAALGRTLALQPDPPQSTLARAAQLLAQSDEAALTVLFRGWVHRRRRAGDRRSPTALAGDGLGLSDPVLLGRLKRSLPLTDRFGLSRNTAGIGITALLVVAAFILGTMMREGPHADASLLVAGIAGAGRAATHEIAFFASDWHALSPIEATDGGSRPHASDAASWYARAGSPDGLTWARSVPSDSGSVDVVIRARDGSEFWLTTDPADDNFEDWSPDGRFVLISTGRWHERSMYDLAVVEVASGAIRQLTRGDGHDITARWSPDGSRVAFVRRSPLTDLPDQLCWATIDGETERCRDLAHRVLADIAWVSPAEMVVSFFAGGEHEAIHVDLPDWDKRDLGVRGTELAFSPDGRWVLCRCLPAGARRLGWYVFPLSEPDALRQIVWDGAADAPMKFYWANSGWRPAFLERLRLDPVVGAVAVGSVIRPRVRGLDSDGQIVLTPVLDWSVSDTAIAVVRPDGSLLARAEGAVTVWVSAGGWRTASTTIRINAGTARTAFRESWTDDHMDAWRSYGVPRPVVRSDSAGGAMLANGDGSHHSGAYTYRTLEPADGIGLEVLLATPITAPQWQHLGVRLVAPTDDTTAAAWDHEIGIPRAIDVAARSCAVGTGSTGIQDGTLHLFLGAGGTQRLIPLPWPPADVRWYRVRIQVLPDGRCGFALDGKPIWVSRAHVPMDRPFRIDINGQTVGSDLLVGPLEAWEGMRMDVDWGAIEQ